MQVAYAPDKSLILVTEKTLNSQAGRKMAPIPKSPVWICGKNPYVVWFMLSMYKCQVKSKMQLEIKKNSLIQ